MQCSNETALEEKHTEAMYFPRGVTEQVLESARLENVQDDRNDASESPTRFHSEANLGEINFDNALAQLAAYSQCPELCELNTEERLSASKMSDLCQAFKVANLEMLCSQEMPAIRRFGKIRRWQRGTLVGSGSYGKVFLGLNKDTAELFVVTLVGEEKCESVAQLEQEIALLGQLEHENIVKYLGTEVNAFSKELSIFLEYMSGGSVADLVKKFGALDEEVMRRYTCNALQGLAFLHEKGIVHRDIKGQNLLVDSNGVCKLADFGSSRFMQSSDGLCKMSFKGTPVFMPPEVIVHQIYSPKSDVWSYGCTLLQMASGNPPFSDLSNPIAALLHITMSSEPPPLPERLSDACRDFILLCIQRDVTSRASVEELLGHEFLLDHGTIADEPEVETETASAAISSMYTSYTTSPNSTTEVGRDLVNDFLAISQSKGIDTSNLDISLFSSQKRLDEGAHCSSLSCAKKNYVQYVESHGTPLMARRGSHRKLADDSDGLVGEMPGADMSSESKCSRARTCSAEIRALEEDGCSRPKIGSAICAAVARKISIEMKPQGNARRFLRSAAKLGPPRAEGDDGTIEAAARQRRVDCRRQASLAGRRLAQKRRKAAEGRSSTDKAVSEGSDGTQSRAASASSVSTEEQAPKTADNDLHWHSVTSAKLQDIAVESESSCSAELDQRQGSDCPKPSGGGSGSTGAIVTIGAEVPVRTLPRNAKRALVLVRLVKVVVLGCLLCWLGAALVKHSRGDFQ